MKAIILSTILIVGLALTIFGQSVVDAIRGIEVSGTAERMVVPDELTFRITLTERMGSRGKITIEQQEAQFRGELEKIGIDLAKDLSIYDISARYVRRKVRDVLASQDYRLVIRDLNKVAPLQEIVDKINASGLDLVIAENSHIEDIRRELRVEAIKAAKTKAEYLMAAINGKVGTAIYVKEVNYDIPDYERRPQYYSYNTAAPANVSGYSRPLSFAPEKVRMVILARFEIQ
ncbi:MAG: SIMPL domain-containing protein [Pyrinomonadaceae bacterium]